MRGLVDLGMFGWVFSFLFFFKQTNQKKALRGACNLLAMEVKGRFFENEMVTTSPNSSKVTWVKAAGK